MTISNAPEAPFAEPWQARAFALAVELHRQGAFTWPRWSAALGARIAASDGGEYYEHWLAALEAILAAEGLVDPRALAARKTDWERAYRDTPHGSPVSLPEAGYSAETETGPPLAPRRGRSGGPTRPASAHKVL